MWKVLVYEIGADNAKYRHFTTQREAEHYARELKKAAFNTPDVPNILIEAMPS